MLFRFEAHLTTSSSLHIPKSLTVFLAEADGSCSPFSLEAATHFLVPNSHICCKDGVNLVSDLDSKDRIETITQSIN